MTVVVLGAAGGIGSHVVDALLAQGRSVRAVTRIAVELPDGVEPFIADLRDPARLRAAVDGADVVVHAAAPSYHRWVQEFPSLTSAVADASEGKRLVFVDNLYGYGPVSKPLTEDLPAAATDAKGRVRTAMANDLEDRHADGRLDVVIGRASDYFGPRGTTSAAGEQMVPAAIAGAVVRVVGATDIPHSWSYLPDVGRALAMLADGPVGRAYHLPVGPPHTQRELADAFARAAGNDRARMSALPPWLHRLLALGHPILRELRSTRYQFDAPFVVDDGRFRREVGSFTSTPLPEAAAATVEWFLGQAS
ncbi:NAD-dependent epimerase/dehydratase family protein [Rhodococcus sp. IEGM 1381]|uniref:NAD-dependent epimerase/dehydratase family protein n=1 Tax=Rhodococcus sp. IEGM 1381 TaxID=3047085 RepID=UPI0024B73AC0|nr:NAD-dependent epimerase/dehydratase family protein [Rhodococcus sp. IEGM 1381]MDI9893224.1 NAD-dependent epimerase/dehydratase family protein [Rhodococcus sp. IEGM 1381]